MTALENPAARAAHSALARQLRLARQGRTTLYPYIGRSARFEVWRHYPRRDAVDLSSRWQFYFHAHATGEDGGARHAEEHGHIHLFRRSPQGQLTHLAGLSLDGRGVPLTWFATNRWVTGGRWQAAEQLARGLDSLELRLHGPLAGAGLWLAELVRLYAEPLAAMLQRRDQSLAAYCARHRVDAEQAWEDRRVAVWSEHPVRWPQDALQAGANNSSVNQVRSST